MVASLTAPLLEISLGLGNSQPPDRDAFASLLAMFQADGEDREAPMVTVDTGGALMAGATSHAANGANPSDVVAAFLQDVIDWIDSGGTSPAATLLVATSAQRPAEWPSDLHALRVAMAIHGDWDALEIVVPPAPGTAASLEAAFENYNGNGGALKVAGDSLCRWGAGGTSVDIRTREPPVFWAPAPLSRERVSGTADGRSYAGVDAGSWLRGFLQAMQSLPETDAAVRRMRARIASAVARTLAPVVRTPGDLPNEAAARAAAAEVLTRDLTAPIACIAQFPAVVQSGIGSDAHPAPAWRIRGSMTNAETAGVPLTEGDPTIEAIVASFLPAARTSTEVELVFRATHIAAPETASLELATPVVMSLGTVTCPVPLTELPGAPVIREASASQDVADSAPDLAQLWAFTVSIASDFAAQDNLAITLRFNAEPAGGARAEPEPGADLPLLFAALARFTYEWPQRPETTRVLAVAANVADALEQWTPATGPMAADPSRDVSRRYTCEWDDDGALTLHRDPGAQDVPAWPLIAGYAQDSHEPGALSSTYRRESAGRLESLTLTWGKLAARSCRSAAADIRVTRNRSLAPAFVLSGPVTSTPVVHAPLLSIDTPITFPAGATLDATFIALLQALAAAPSGAHVLGPPISAVVDLAIAYSYAIAGDIRARIPILKGQTPLSDDRVPAIASELASNIRAWRTSVMPGGSAPRFEMTISVLVPDGDAGLTPASRLHEVILEIGDLPAWWG